MTGPHIVRGLTTAGHEVTVFHRGKTPLKDAPKPAHPEALEGRPRVSTPAGVREILGDRDELSQHRAEFERLSPDVVIDMLAFTHAGAENFVATFRGMTGRAVVISSADVYLAYGRLHHTEPGPLEPVPLTEESPLRRELGPEGEKYDKPAVEAILQAAKDLPATIIRYPAVYGPGDGQRRFFAYVKRMADHRPAIVLGESEAHFRFTHAYAEDAAHAVVLAATSPGAAGRVYNVAERETPDWQQRVRDLARVMEWKGEVVVVPDERATMPAHHTQPDLQQHLVLDSARVRAELGYSEIVPYEEGLRRTAQWLLNNSGEIDPTHFDYEAEDRLLAARATS
jgi:nucleoside-diphosphate-sugar epimerase